MADKLEKIVYLSNAQQAELFENGTINVNGVVLTYSENDIYINPQHWDIDGESIPNLYIKDATGAVRLSIANNGTVSAGAFMGNGELLESLRADAITQGVISEERLPKATKEDYGTVRVGSNTIQDKNVSDVTNIAGRTYAIQKNNDDQLVVNVPWADTYILPLASAVRGGIKAATKGAGDTVEVKIDTSSEKLFVPTYPTTLPASSVSLATIAANTLNGYTHGNAILRQNTGSDGRVIVGSNVRPLRITGSEDRPKYSKSSPTTEGAHQVDLALFSDIPTNLNQFINGPGYVTTSGITSASLTTGTANGTIRLTTNGSTGSNVSVYGLGALAYKAAILLSDLPKSSTANTFLKVETANSTPTYSQIFATDVGYNDGQTSVESALISISQSLNSLSTGKEPAFSKNTAFNKNFGNSSGTVSEGNHSHSATAIYMQSEQRSVEDKLIDLEYYKQDRVARLTNLLSLGTSSGNLRVTGADTWTIDTTSYAPLASPNFSGTPAILTKAIATQEWVTSQGYKTSSGVTTINGTSPISVSGGTTATATVSLANNYGDTKNPYASKTAKYFLASPNASSGVPTFRTIVASDIPILNQNTTGNAATADWAHKADELEVARTIGISGGATGTPTGFKGDENITIPITSLNATMLSGKVPLASIPTGVLKKYSWTAGTGTLIIEEL